MCKSTGLFGSFVRLWLVILNLVVFLIGVLVFTLSAILRWNPNFIIDEITNDKALESILNFSGLETVSNSLLVVGGLLIVMGFIGLVGALCASKFCLISYEVLMVLIFLSHGILVLVVTFTSADLETEFRKELNKTVDTLNSPNATAIQFKNQCATMKALSTIFECCGADGPNDFVNQTIVDDCCMSKVYVGCGDKTVDTIKNDGIQIILIPNVVFLVLELILILVIPCLVTSIKNAGRRRDAEDRFHDDSTGRVNYLRPTTEFRKSYGSLEFDGKYN